MKTLILRSALCYTLFLAFLSPVKAQWVSIPDTNFAWYLANNGYSACLQGNNTIGWQMDTTCPNVVNTVSLTCNSRNIHDLTGIIYFDNLGGLSCRTNRLSFLPELPGGLISLLCDNNQLSSLPPLPAGLTFLQCYLNQLSSLPDLPAGLTTLVCYSNQLSSLPDLPAALTDLNCMYNQLTSLPPFPAVLTSLRCNNNQLSSLPALPDSMYTCIVNNNPLNCLPYLNRVVSLDFNNTNVTCVPNYGNVDYSFPPVQTLPECDEFNTNGCPIYSHISGRVYLDTDSNCVGDSLENNVTNIPVLLTGNGTIVRHLSHAGIYSFATASGSYEVSIDTTRLPFFVTCPVANVYPDTISTADTVHYGRDFGLQCKPGFDLAAWSVYDRFTRPADIRRVDIHVGSSSTFYGINCSNGISGSVTVAIAGYATYISPAPGALTPDNVSGNLIEYYVTDFGTVDFNNSFNVIVQTDTNAVLGSQICYTVTVAPVTGDDLPFNNMQTFCVTIVGSFDPNDKQVYPLSDVDVNGERWLTYTVNFQNTGTDTAIHIYITDTLDSDLDVSTFQLLAYSHQPLVQLKENAVRFNFPNILLVDSHANEPLSHGYVQYKIKIKDGKPVGTVINNTAYIYFDFNAPVVTNTTTNTVAIISAIPPDPLKGELLRLYPNPANSSVTLEMDNAFTGGAVTVSDITGRAVKAVQLATRNLQLETSSFANGVYFVTVTDKEGRSATKKLVIQK